MNKVIMLGNLTRDPELMYLANQTAVCKFGLAVNRKWKDSTGNKKEDVCFIDCTAFGSPCETINKYLKKGNKALIEGRLHLEQWESKDGKKRSKHGIIVEHFEFAGAPQDNQTPRPAQNSQPPLPLPPTPQEGFDPPSDSDDSIPF